MGPHLVFLYGTLMRGQPNFHVMDRSKYVCEALTVEPRALVIASHFNIPFLLHNEGDVSSEDKQVHGELYLVDDEHLEMLDKFENVPDLYWRTGIEVRRKDSNEVVKALTYVLPHFKSEVAKAKRIERFDVKILEDLGKTSFVPPEGGCSNESFINEVRTG